MFLCKRWFLFLSPHPFMLAPFFSSPLSAAPQRVPLILFEEAGDKRLTGVCHGSQRRDVQRMLVVILSPQRNSWPTARVEWAGGWLYFEVLYWYPLKSADLGEAPVPWQH